MCGVFGYVGKPRGDLSDFLLAGLKKLEYRGYDSAGIAVFTNSGLKVVKETGKLSNLVNRLKGKVYGGTVGIGHTRWATHGGVTIKNAHPHTDCTGRIVVVHNGIIENYEEIKKDLIQKGHKFVSETDTEIFPHLVEQKIKDDKDLSFLEAVRASFNELAGLNAIIAVKAEGEIVAFRKGSPLVAGIGEGGNYVSSDIPGLSFVTDKLVLIDEGEGVYIKADKVFLVKGRNGKVTEAKPVKVKMETSEVDKGIFPHFLLKEIYEQPEVLARIGNNGKEEIQKAANLIKNAWGTYFTACGSAAHAGQIATYLFADIAKRHVNFSVASEFPYFQNFLVPRSLLIAASQSGETMDTLEAVRAAKARGAKVLAVVNVPGSSLARLADYTIFLKAGPERAVLSTKAYTAKLSFFLLFAYALIGKYEKGAELVRAAGKHLSAMFKEGIDKKIASLSVKLKDSQSIYLIGRGMNYPTALEGALKIKEDAYIHAEGFPGGELKHGVIALIQEGTPCIAIVANDEARQSVLSNAMELKSRGAYIIGIAPQEESVFDFWIKVPDVGPASPIVNALPLQLLGYHLAVLRGFNPDMPRNLAKSVTVK